MDKRILDHASALFTRALSELLPQETEERRLVHADANARGISNSGIALGNLLTASGNAIGRRTQARLQSFQDAFSAAKSEPSPDDFQFIWTQVATVHQQGIDNANHQLALQARQMNRGAEARLPNVQAAAAHGFNAANAEFRVWQSRVGLAGVSQSFANASAVPLNELKDKAACWSDLQNLLDSDPQASVAVLYIDLDNFKSVNTAMGHDGGDKCIERAAAIIGSVVAHKGRLYRLHGTGDEFGVLLPNYDASEARVTAERIRKAVEEHRPGEDILVTTSIGGLIATGKITAAEALAEADKAMYEAKKTKNTVYWRESS